MKIAGLDIGTTGCKCTVFDENGSYLDRAYQDYPVSRSADGHEMDAAAVMDGVWAVLRQMGLKFPDIAGIGVTSFGETFVCADDQGKPLLPAMLYTDPRGEAECRELCERLGEKRIAHITGLRPHEMYSISKIMWVKRHCPDVYRKTKHIFLMEDYVVYHLTGIAQIDYSLATRTMAFDIRRLAWSEEVFAAAGIDSSLLSKTVPTGTAAGCLLPSAAEKTGLNQKTVIVSVSHDQIAACVGAGVFDSSAAADGAGTVECLTPVYDTLPDIDVMYEGYYAVVPHVISGKYAAYAFSYTGGALLQWCTDTLAKKEKETAAREGISVNEYLEREYLSEKGENPSGLLVLPHFAGAATPYMDTGSKGVILGLTTSTTTAEIYRACMEGVAYEMYLNMEKLAASGIHFDRIHATGGGAHSAVWMQMKADILNIPMVELRTADAGTVGSAMLTGIAVGLFTDLEDAAAHMVEKSNEYHPRKEMHEKYMKNFSRYRQIYQAVRPLV